MPGNGVAATIHRQLQHQLSPFFLQKADEQPRLVHLGEALLAPRRGDPPRNGNAKGPRRRRGIGQNNAWDVIPPASRRQIEILVNHGLRSTGRR